MNTLYISGPMSNLPRFNAPAFEEAARVLRGKGFDIVSPLELDDPEVQEIAQHSVAGDPNDLPAKHTWGTLLGRDVTIIADKCDGIVLLPGWEESRGARLEVATALLTDKTFALFFGADPIPVTRYYVIARLRF